MRAWSAAAADALAITTFATIGRLSHDEGATLSGVALTAWPFLAGGALGTLVNRLTSARVGSPRDGLTVWASTLVGGMLLRAATGGGVQVSFVVVAGTVLAGFLLGWRGLYALVVRARSRSEIAA